MIHAHLLISYRLLSIIIIIFTVSLSRVSSLFSDTGSSKLDPNYISLELLFAHTKEAQNREIPDKAKKLITVEQFSELIIKDVDTFSDKDFQVIKKSLLNSSNLNIATIAIKFIDSKNERLEEFGFELIEDICINKPQFLRPNKFYMILAKRGFGAEFLLNNIIKNSKDDFSREWAAELYVDIFYNNKNSGDSRFVKISEVVQMEKDVYSKLKGIFTNPKKVEELLTSKQNLGKQIREKWGMESRSTLKLLAVMKLLDNLNEKNQFATREKLLKTLKSYNFNYNILNRINGQPIKLPLIKDNVKLRYLSNAIFSDNTTNTFKWITKENGGFSKDDVKIAIQNNNISQINSMIKTLQTILSTVLRGKLLLGLGNRELKLLRYFYSANWKEKEMNINDRMVTISNMTGEGAPLILSKLKSKVDTLTGKSSMVKSDKDIFKNFYIPSQSTFLWFLPKGDYSISINKKNSAIRVDNLLSFKEKYFSIKNSNISFNLL